MRNMEFTCRHCGEKVLVNFRTVKNFEYFKAGDGALMMAIRRPRCSNIIECYATFQRMEKYLDEEEKSEERQHETRQEKFLREMKTGIRGLDLDW